MIGVVGDHEAADRVAAALDVGGAQSADELLDAAPEAVIAVGEAAVIDLVAAGVERPTLPVDVDGLPSVAPAEVSGLIERYRDGDATTTNHPVLAVETAAGPIGSAVFDVMLVRSEPGRISEFGLQAGSARARFRADGVVAATPAGSDGYAHAAGGPRIGADAEVVAVVPVAAFGLGAPSWVVKPSDGVELRVERDEGDVSILLDGRECERLSGRSTVTIAPGGRLEIITPEG